MENTTTQPNSFEIFKKSVYDFCGQNAIESITKYFNRGYTLKKVDFSDGESVELHHSITRMKTATEFKQLRFRDLQALSNLGNYAKAGNIDAMHCFLIIQDAQTLQKGIYYLDGDELYLTDKEYSEETLQDIMQAGNRGEADTLQIAKIPALLIIVAEHNLKMVKYKELGYEYCLLEAGMMLQNLYTAGVDTSLAIRPMGSYSKIEAINKLGLNNRHFTPMITAIIGSND